MFASGSGGYISVHESEKIQTNTSAAIHASGSGIVAAWIAASIYDGLNKVMGGKLHAISGAILYFGDSSSLQSKNHFCDGDAATLEVGSGGTIYARYNYWPPTGGPTQINNGGTIYYSNPLGTADCTGMSLMLAGGGTPNQSPPLSSSYMEVSSDNDDGGDNPDRRRLFEAKAKAVIGRHAEAAQIFTSIIEGGRMPEAHSALLELGQLERRHPMPGVGAYIENLAGQSGTLQVTAMHVLAGVYGAHEDFDAAEAVLDNIIQSHPSTTDAFSAGINKFYLLFETGRREDSRAVLENIQSSSEDELHALVGAWYAFDRESGENNMARFGFDAEEPEAQADGLAASSEIRLENYPNPFNPSTVVRFSVPDEMHVTVEVFDMLGRRIARLIDDVVGAGTHDIHYETTALPSGTYMVRLTAGRSAATKIMMLLR